jgi:hypothetical protein
MLEMEQPIRCRHTRANARMQLYFTKGGTVMTAHCHIAQRLSDGRIKAVYVHYAEPEAQIGLLLAQQYREAAQVSSLLDLGDLKKLGATPTAYDDHRQDQGESSTGAYVYQDMNALLDAARTSSVIYLYENGRWLASIGSGEWYRVKLTGYIEWHGPIVGRIEALVEEARSLKRPFDQEEVIYPLWDAGYGFMLHLDERFQRYRDELFKPRLWIVKSVQVTVAA